MDTQVTRHEIPVQWTVTRPRITAKEAAWWLWTGEADPTLASRFMHGTPEEAKRREHIANRVAALMDAAEAAGIGNELTGILADLFLQSSTRRTDQ